MSSTSSSIHSSSPSTHSSARGPRHLPSDPNRPFPFQLAQQQAREKEIAVEQERLRKERIQRQKIQAKVGPVEAFAKHYKNQRQLPQGSSGGHARARSELNDGSIYSNRSRNPDRLTSSLEDLTFSLDRTGLNATPNIPTPLVSGSNSTNGMNTASSSTSISNHHSYPSSSSSYTSSNTTSKHNPQLRIKPPTYNHSSSSGSIPSSTSSTSSSPTSSSPKSKPLPSLPLARTISQLKHQTQNQLPYSSAEYLSRVARVESQGDGHGIGIGSESNLQPKVTSIPNLEVGNLNDIGQRSNQVSSNHSQAHPVPTSRPLPNHPQQPAFGLPRPPMLMSDNIADISALKGFENGTFNSQPPPATSRIDRDRSNESLGPIQSHASRYLSAQNQKAPNLSLSDGFREVSTPLPHMPEPAVAPRSSELSFEHSFKSNSTSEGSPRIQMPIPDLDVRRHVRNPQLTSVPIHRPIPISRPHSFDPSDSLDTLTHSISNSYPMVNSHSTPNSYQSTPSLYSEPSPRLPILGGSTPNSFLDTPSCYSSDSPLSGSTSFGKATSPSCPNPWFEDQNQNLMNLVTPNSAPKLLNTSSLQSSTTTSSKASSTSSVKPSKNHQNVSSSEPSASSKLSTPKVKPSSTVQSDPSLPPAKNQCWGIKKDGKRCTRKVGNDVVPSRGNRSSPAPKGKGKGKKRLEDRGDEISKSNSKNDAIDLVSDSDDSDYDQDQSISFQSNSTARSRSISPRKPIAKNSSPQKVITIDASDSDDEDEEEFEEDYCYQHAKEINLATGFYLNSATSSDRIWVEFSKYIPSSIPINLAARIRTNMTSPLTPSDLSPLNQGYIYIYELRDRRTVSSDGISMICLKIGRAKNVFKRMSEWRSQCQSKEPILRYFSPETREEKEGIREQVLISGLGRTERVGIKGSHRWERLIHLELSDYKIKEKCVDCGSLHQEIFLVPDDDGKGFERCRDIVRKWEEWERIVVGEDDDDEVEVVGVKGRNGRSWDLS